MNDGLAGLRVPFLKKLQCSSNGLFCVYKFPIEPFVIWISVKGKTWNFSAQSVSHSKMRHCPDLPTASVTEETAPDRPVCSFEIAVLLPKALKALENFKNFSLYVRLEKPNDVTVDVVKTWVFLLMNSVHSAYERVFIFAEWKLWCVLQWMEFPALPVRSQCAKVTLNWLFLPICLLLPKPVAFSSCFPGICT